MSKRLIILIYVVVVLLFSGFIAQAKTVPELVGVEKARIDQKNGVLYLEGRFPTPCYTKPLVTIDKIDEATNQIFLSVVADHNSHICSAVLGPEFEVSVNLQELPLTGGKIYSFIVNHYTGTRVRLTYSVQSKGQAHNSLPKNVFSGTLQQITGGYVLVKNNEALPIAQTEIYLPAHLNKKVWITGYASSLNTYSELVPITVSSLH